MQVPQGQQQRQQLNVSLMLKNIDKLFILGSGPSLIQYKHKKGNIVWCPVAMKNPEMDKITTNYFGLHNNERGLYEGIIDQRNYPLDEIINKFNSYFFTSTISYMIAYALYIGVKEIEIYGVDMIGREEYINQRSSVLYWIGRAEGLGVKVNHISGVDKPTFLYGFNEKQHILDKINNLRTWAKIEREKATDQRVIDQYHGFIYGLDSIEKEL